MSAEKVDDGAALEKLQELEIASDGDEDSSNSENEENPENISSSTTNKAEILTKFASKIKTDEFMFKNKSLSKDKSDRATLENVLDPRTIGFIVKLIKKGTITKINGCISTGKEANVYHATNEETGKEYAVKIYKTSILVFRDRERYVDGEFRFRNSRSQHNPRKMIKIWAEKEFRNLKRLYLSGMNSPEPVDLKSHVLVMEFLSDGEDGFPSPKLKDYPFEDEQEILRFYYEMIYSIKFMYRKCRLVHADLSEYNSIVHDNKLYIFDVSQSVEPEHPMALDFLRMDIKNINDFFAKQGIEVFSEISIFQFVISDDFVVLIDQHDEVIQQIKNLKVKQDHDDENEDIFRSLHLVRSLQHLEERDFEKFRKGDIDTLKQLTGKKEDAGEDGEDSGSEDEDSEGDDSEDSEEEDEEHDEEAEGTKKWVDRPTVLKGKKHEDKEAKKERKLKAKEDAKEKRKTKMKKHIKKKLVNKSKTK